MFEPALDEMFRPHVPDVWRIRHHIHHAGNFFALMTDHYGRNLERKHFIQPIPIARDDAVRVQRLKYRPSAFQTSRLPIKRPRPMIVSVIRHAIEQRATRSAGRLDQQYNLWDA